MAMRPYRSIKLFFVPRPVHTDSISHSLRLWYTEESERGPRRIRSVFFAPPDKSLGPRSTQHPSIDTKVMAPLSHPSTTAVSRRSVYRRLFFLVIKGSVSIAIVWVLVSRIDFQLLSERLDSHDILPLAFGFLTGILIMVVTALRWWGIHRRIRASIPFLFSVPATFECFALNLTLPGSVGCDVVRAARARRLCGRLRESIMAVLLDRGGNLAAQMTMCLTALPFLQSSMASDDLKLAIYSVFSIGVIGVLVIYGAPAMIGNSRFKRFRLARELMRVGFIFRRIVLMPVAIIEIACLSFIIQTLNVVMIWAAVLALGYEGISPFTLIIGMAFGMLGAALPISLGGLGVREGAIVWVFLETGLALHDALMIAIVFGALVLSQAVPGLLILVSRRLPPLINR